MSDPAAKTAAPAAPGAVVVVTCHIAERVIWCSNGHVYQLQRSLRDCIYGQVMAGVECLRRPDGRYEAASETPQVALKMMTKELINRAHAIATRERKPFENPIAELSTLQYLSQPGHPNLVRLVETLNDDTNLIPVLEYCDGGELYDVVTKSKAQKFDVPTAQHLFKQTMEAMAYCHSKAVCHRDMSLENLLLHRGSVIKLIDFGLAVIMPRDPAGTGFLPLAPCGATGKATYMPPEFLANKPYYGDKSDIWSCGVILSIMLLGTPFCKLATEADKRYVILVTEGPISLLRRWRLDDTIPASAVDLLTRMLQKDPARRPTAAQVLAHPFLTPPAPPPVPPRGGRAAGAGAAEVGAGAGAGAGRPAGAGPTASGGDSGAGSGDVAMGGAGGSGAAGESADALAARAARAVRAAASAAATAEAGASAETPDLDDDIDMV